MSDTVPRALEKPLSRDDAGMTLIEMLIAMVVLAIIVVPVVTSVYLLLVGTSNAKQTAEDSGTAQLMSSYFTADISSSTSATYNAALDTCASNVPSATSTLWSFQWPDPNTAGQQDEAAYVLSLGSSILNRVYCTSTTPPTVTTLVSQVPLVQNVSSVPVPTCVPSCSSTPQQITQQVVVQAPTERTAYYSSFTYSLTGSRRVQP